MFFVLTLLIKREKKITFPVHGHLLQQTSVGPAVEVKRLSPEMSCAPTAKDLPSPSDCSVLQATV